RYIADEIEIELVIKRCVDGVRYAADEESVPICGRTHHRLRGEIAAATWPILDYKRLAEPLRQPLSNHPGGDVGRPAGGKADDDADRPRWIGLRPRYPRHCRQRGSARGQMQKLSAGKFHFCQSLSRLHSINSSARSKNASGIFSPMAFAVVRLMTRSNLVGCSTGMSAGFAPRRILSTKSPARR